jgi:hypothetical protein
MTLPDLYFHASAQIARQLDQLVDRGIRTCRERPCWCGYCEVLLVLNVVDLHTVATILGHQSLEVTKRYAHLSPGHMLAAIAHISFDDAEPVVNKATVCVEKVIRFPSPADLTG